MNKLSLLLIFFPLAKMSFVVAALSPTVYKNVDSKIKK